MSGVVVFWGWVALILHRLDPHIGWSLPVWLRPLGLIGIVGGAALGLGCGVLFARVGRGTPAPFDPPRKFVAVGPYRYVRNPMYVGGLSVLAGLGLVLRSPAVLLLAVALWIGAHCFVVFFEEPDLERRFGEIYLEYRRAVRRWLPSLRPVAAGEQRRER